eukprot:2939160-Pyramimonas_sp.AAC.1
MIVRVISWHVRITTSPWGQLNLSLRMPNLDGPLRSGMRNSCWFLGVQPFRKTGWRRISREASLALRCWSGVRSP